VRLRSLSVKLTLAFLLVGLTGAVLVALLVRNLTQTAFDQFVVDRDQQALANTLEQFFVLRGGWDGVDTLIDNISRRPGPGNDPRRDPRRLMDRFTLVDKNGVVLLSGVPERVGTLFPQADLNTALALKVNNETIGWLSRDAGNRTLAISGPEGIFLERVNSAIVLSALAAVALALILGGLLAYTLTRSMRELREAVDEIARGRLGAQVKVRSNDELGDLAASFNRMSADLARATEARRQMTADVAHDLRTPLSVLSGYAEALSDGKLSGTPEIYSVLYQETQYLRRLVDDLRLLSLADAGELLLNLQPVLVRPLLEQAAVRHSLAVGANRVSLTVEAGEPLPPVIADPERLSQILDNLIANALRYTPTGGGIQLAAGEVPGFVQIQVRDTGSGIDPQDLPYIFDRLYRSDKSRHSNGESGLGLAITKSLVEAMHGEIVVDSQMGVGTTFTLRLPG
jgi:signal transduction histidine kinase